MKIAFRYPWYIPGIYQVYTASQARNMHGISMYIPTISGYLRLVGVPDGHVQSSRPAGGSESDGPTRDESLAAVTDSESGSAES